MKKKTAINPKRLTAISKDLQYKDSNNLINNSLLLVLSIIETAFCFSLSVVLLVMLNAL